MAGKEDTKDVSRDQTPLSPPRARLRGDATPEKERGKEMNFTTKIGIYITATAILILTLRMAGQ